MTPLVLAAAITMMTFLVVIGMYNALVRVRNHVREAWADVDTELKRRYDLIPNLVSTVKGYAQHERELLEQVTRLREAAANNNGSPASQAESENAFQGALDRLLVRVEAYPDLKASQNFLDLQRELTNTEDRIQAARRFYNGNVREMNNSVQTFPSILIARAFGFTEEEYFELRGSVERSAPSAKI